ncbi:hypothetical protein LPJ56_005115 [Coemansia sp. RSA 2599]|nr:hypothetical protein LPJ56_005115 [Coemansia sp. RSA 2599]
MFSLADLSVDDLLVQLYKDIESQAQVVPSPVLFGTEFDEMSTAANSPASTFDNSALRRASMPTLAAGAKNATSVFVPQNMTVQDQQQYRYQQLQLQQLQQMQQMQQSNAVFGEILCNSAVPDINWLNAVASLPQWHHQQQQQAQSCSKPRTDASVSASSSPGSSPSSTGSNKRSLSSIAESERELRNNALLSDPLALLDFVKYSSMPFATVGDSLTSQTEPPMEQSCKRRRVAETSQKPREIEQPAQREQPVPESPTETERSSVKTSKYQCSRCKKYFTRPSSLATHTYTHTGEKPHECPIAGCTKRFSVLSNMRRHMRLHQEPVVPRNRRKTQHEQFYVGHPYGIVRPGQPLSHQQHQHLPYVYPMYDGQMPLMPHMVPAFFASQFAPAVQSGLPQSVPGMGIAMTLPMSMSTSPVCAASAAANMPRRFSTPAFSLRVADAQPQPQPLVTPGCGSDSEDSGVFAGQGAPSLSASPRQLRQKQQTTVVYMPNSTAMASSIDARQSRLLLEEMMELQKN